MLVFLDRGVLSASEMIIGSLDMLTDLVKGLDLLAIVIPHEKLTFHDAGALKFALGSADRQICYDGAVDAGSVGGAVLITLEEDLDLMAGFGQTDVDLIILAIVFLFDAHGSSLG